MIIEETLIDCAITALKCTRKIIQFRTIMLIKGHGKVGMPTSDSCLQKKIFQINIDSSLSYVNMYYIYMYVCLFVYIVYKMEDRFIKYLFISDGVNV
jgi:hypothetical protein